MDSVDNEKYVTFKREEFVTWIGLLSTMDLRETNPGALLTEALELRLEDAVVIRRQDLFAAPALATYASMIGMVAQNISNPTVSKELLSIADYFDHQAGIAADEGYKLPDL